MKNFLIIFFLFFFSFALAEDDLIFKSNSIEYKDNNNLIIAKGNVIITSSKDIDIFSEESQYFKLTKKLFLLGNVRVVDKRRDLTIKSEKIDYDKKLEIIRSYGKTQILIGKDYIINTSNLNYSRSDNILKSNNKTKLTDTLDNKIETNDFIYFAGKKKFQSKNLKFTDKDLNEYITSNSLVDLNSNQIVAKDVEIYFSKNGSFGENTRLKGNSMFSDTDKTVIKKGIFTTCKPRDDCPPWTMQSDTIMHNKKDKIIEYKKAWLKLYDKPVFYFPRFFHPDPTVKRQSGFLIPSIATSSNSGNSIKIPYFNALADNKDFTIVPRFYFNNDILLQNEYRQIEKNLNHISDFSLKKLDGGTKSHFFSNSKIDLETNELKDSILEINVEKTSNDTYLKSEKLKNSIQNNQSLLNSFVRYETFSNDIDFSAEVASYEDLTKEKNSDKYQFILPSFRFSKIFSTNSDIKGNLRYSASGVNQKRNTNISENYLINNFDYSSNNFFSKKGFVNNFKFFYKNVSKKGKNSIEYNENFTNRNFLSTNYNTSLPLKKNGLNFNSNLSPKISLRYSPFDNQNISSLDRKGLVGGKETN